MKHWSFPFGKDKSDIEGIQKRLSKVSSTGEDSFMKRQEKNLIALPVSRTSRKNQTWPFKPNAII